MALKPAHLQWSDGSTLRSVDFDDIYFQPQQGPEESYYVFLEQNRLPQRFAAAPAEGMRIAELGFGSGLNFLLTAQLWHKHQPVAPLLYVSIEKHPIPVDDLRRIFAFWPELREYAAPLLEQYPPLVEGFHHLRFLDNKIHLMLCFGDVAEVLPELTGTFDAWYLDGFSPAKNPAMWEEKLFPLIAARTKPGGTLTTFSSAGAVRRGLQAAGFTVEKTAGFGCKRDMTAAKMPATAWHHPSPQKRVVVLGAGLAGASVAFACAQKGLDVTVIDRQSGAAQETSGNPVSVVYPKLTIDKSPLGIFYQHGFCFTRALAAALKLPSWNPCGVINLNTCDEDERRHQTLAASGDWPEEYMVYEETEAGMGLRLPLAGYLSPPELCRRMLDHPKIKTVFSTEVSALETLDYDAVVLALGNNTKIFPVTAWLPLHSRRGQMTYLKATPQSEKVTRIICHEGGISPPVNGIHYAGATFQHEEPGLPDLRDCDHREMLARLNKYNPELGFTAADVVGGRAGYRATTPDHMPIIGPCPDYAAFMEIFAGLRIGKNTATEGKFVDRLYIATGFGGQGLPGAPLAGEIVACQISGDPLPVPASLMPYLAPERFILRDLKRGKI